MDMVLLEGGYLFVGLHTGKADGLIKVWNTATGAEQALPGPQVRIHANGGTFNMQASAVAGHMQIALASCCCQAMRCAQTPSGS